MALSPNAYRNSFIRKVAQTIAAHRMFAPGDAVLTGVSGGPDSVALLAALNLLAPGLDLRLGVAHFHHNLRTKEADRDARFAEKLAASFGLPFYWQKAEAGAYQNKSGSVEETARRLRYAFLTTTAVKKGFTRIALGHQAGDNAELVLMFLLRGTGPLGLAGIPPVRHIQGHPVTIVRPLIQTTRTEIETFLKKQDLAYVTDSMNAEPRYMRSRIRHQLIPLLKKDYNPRIHSSLNRLAQIVRSEEDWLARITAAHFNKALVSEAPGQIVLSVSKLAGLETPLKRRILRYAVEKVKGDLRRISFGHIETLLEALAGGDEPKQYDLPDWLQVCHTAGELIFSNRRNRPLREIRFAYAVSGPGEILIKETGMRMRLSIIAAAQQPHFDRAGQRIAFLDMEQLAFPLLVRNVRPGDRFVPLGMAGSQKLSDFFINQKLARPERLCCPLLVWGEKIVWVGGLRIAESVKITPGTEKILKCELVLA